VDSCQPPSGGRDFVRARCQQLYSLTTTQRNSQRSQRSVASDTTQHNSGNAAAASTRLIAAVAQIQTQLCMDWQQQQGQPMCAAPPTARHWWTRAVLAPVLLPQSAPASNAVTVVPASNVLNASGQQASSSGSWRWQRRSTTARAAWWTGQPASARASASDVDHRPHASLPQQQRANSWSNDYNQWVTACACRVLPCHVMRMLMRPRRRPRPRRAHRAWGGNT